MIPFDTDLISIGLSILNRLPTRTVIFRYNRYGSDEKYCHLNKLLQAVETDEKRPSLQLLSKQRSGLGKILTSLYVVSGNDQVLHTYGLGKKNLFKLFFDHTDFVRGLTNDSQGSLNELFPNINENNDIQITAVCSVVRLLACGYFFKYRSAFPQSATVDELLLESSGGTSYEKHRSLLNLLRERIWPRITTERHLPPSLTAVIKHCLRASFYLRQRTFSSLGEKSPIGNGWIFSNGVLCIEWEDEDVAQDLRTQKEILLFKCCCRKKRCAKGTNCKCRKNALACGPLCRCESCSNNNKDELEEEDNEDANESNDSSEDEKDEKMLEDVDENSDIYELETENDDENAGILDVLAEPQI